MESPTRSSTSLRSEYQYHHKPAQSSPLRSVFASGTPGTGKRGKGCTGRSMLRGGDGGMPFALTIPPLPPSSISGERIGGKNATPRAAGRVGDENAGAVVPGTVRKDATPTVRTKRSAVPMGEQTMFAPVLLAVGDQSLLMEQQLPSYKDLWNDSEEEGDDDGFASFADSMEAAGLRDGSVRSRGGKVLPRKSILGASAAGNLASVVAGVGKSKDRISESRLASLYKPTPKPDTSSRRRSTLFARESIYGEKGFQFTKEGTGDVLVPLDGPSSPIAMAEDSRFDGDLLVDETMGGMRAGYGGSDTEEEGGMDVAVADEQVRAGTQDRNGSQVLASQGSLASASQSIPALTQSQTDIARPSPSLTARRRSPEISSAITATPRSPAHLAAASKKRTPSQRPEASATPSRRSAALTASARNSPNPRARKSARKSTKGVKNISMTDVPPSSPNVPLATEMRQSLSAAQSKQPAKSRRRSTTAPTQATKRRPRASKAQAPASASQPVVSKTRRLSGRKSTGSLPSSQNTVSTVKRTRHSLSASAPKSGSPLNGRRRPRQSLAPLELVERVGLLDIPQRPASPTEDPLLLIPSARLSVGSGRGSVSSRMTQERRDTIRKNVAKGDSPNVNHPRESDSSSPLADIQESQAQSEIVNAYEDNDSHDIPAVLSTPSSQPDRQRAGSRGLGSSPWVSANLSIFSPTAMASSPIRPSPVRWRIASPLPEMEVPRTAEISTTVDAEPEVAEMPQSAIAEDHPISRESTPRAGQDAERKAEMTSSPTQHGSEREEPQFEDVAVDYMQETDWRAFEREDSPMSSHDGEPGGDDVAAEKDDVLREEVRADSPEATPEDHAEAVETQPNTEHEPEASDEPDMLPEQSVPALEPQASSKQTTQDSTEIDQPVISTKKKVGRICLRLPLHPTIVKVEPADDQYAIASKETETSTTTETEDGPSVVANDPEAPSGEQQPPLLGGEGFSDQETESFVPEEEQASVSLTDIPKEESLACENGEAEIQDLDVQAAVEQLDAVVERSELVVETPTTVVSEDASTATETSVVAQSSATVIHADSPFQERTTQVIVSQPPLASQGETSSKRLFKESVSSISVTSEDPRAAARAAALLKLHHRYLNEGPGIEIVSSISLPTPENVKASPRRRRISQYFQSAETASSLTLPELLQEAELELVDNTAFDIRATLSSITSGPTPIYSPFPMPGSWSSINPAMSGLSKGRINFGQWTIEDWQDLERCYKRIYKKKAKNDSHGKHMWNADDSTEVVHSLCKLKRVAIYELRDEWARETLLLRINTLHRKRKSATSDTTDSRVVSATTTRSPKRLKTNDLNAVECPVPAVPASSSQRLKGMLSKGWRSVLQILKPSKSVDSTPVVEADLSTVPAEREKAHRDSTAPGSKLAKSPHLTASGRESVTKTPVPSAEVATPAAPVNQHQTVMQEMTARRASVLARAKELENVLQRDAAVPLARPQLNRSTSTTSSLARRFATPDASSSRPILSLPRRSLGSPQASPSVKNMIQSFERSFEDESANADKTDSPVSHELRRLSSRRSVSGKSSLREVLEAGMGGAKHHAT